MTERRGNENRAKEERNRRNRFGKEKKEEIKKPSKNAILMKSRRPMNERKMTFDRE